MRWLALTGALVALAAGPAAAYRIGIFADPEATTCSLQVRERTPEYLWVVALLDDSQERFIAGAEFRIMGLPTDLLVTPYLQYPGWVWHLREVDAAVAGGMILAFFDPLPVSRGLLPLLKMEIVALRPVGPTRVWVERASPPTNPSYEGPVLIVEEPPLGECDGGSPRYEPVPATGLAAMINGPCSLDVQGTTWQRVKILYR